MSANRVACCLLIVACATGAHAQTEWIVDPEGPVLEPAPPGSWDHGLRLIQDVIKVDGIYHMFYRGQPEEDGLFGTYAIGHATSTDGLSWVLDPANPVLYPGSESEWDHGSIRGAAVIHDGTRFRIWYAAVTPSGYYGIDDLWHGVGHATSTDGSTWSKSAENPIIAPGSDGTLAVPQTVIYDGENFRMWYTASSLSAGDGGTPATSEDGMSWGWFQYVPSARLQTQGLSVVSDGARYLMMKWSWGYDPFIWGAASTEGHFWSALVDYPMINPAASPAVLFDGDTLVMWYSHPWDGGIYRAASTCCNTTYTWFLLAAASGAGSSGSFYRTEVEINNAGEEPAEYNFAWFPRDQDNTEWTRSQLFQIEAGENIRYVDVLSEVFDLGPGSFGALAVEATTEDLLAVGRISTTDDQNAGAFGQSIPAVRVDAFYNSSWPGQRILFGTEDADERFNITCFYGRDWRGTRMIQLDLYDAGGALLGTRGLRLQPFGSHQFNRVFEDFRPIDGYVQMRDDWGTYCFGSRIDNRTNDPTTILPR